MEVTAWSNGQSTYGVRVGTHSRAQYFAGRPERIEVSIDGQNHEFELTSGFWKKCPEFRDAGGTAIRDWLNQHHTTSWPKGQPPRFELYALGGDRFRLGD